jgi:hypothetical protein
MHRLEYVFMALTIIAIAAWVNSPLAIIPAGLALADSLGGNLFA